MVASWAAARSAEIFLIKVPTRGKKKKKKKKKKVAFGHFFFLFLFLLLPLPLGGEILAQRFPSPVSELGKESFLLALLHFWSFLSCFSFVTCFSFLSLFSFLSFLASFLNCLFLFWLSPSLQQQHQGATSGNHNYLRHCTCPSLSRKGKLLQCALAPNGPLASPLDPGGKKGIVVP